MVQLLPKKKTRQCPNCKRLLGQYHFHFVLSDDVEGGKIIAESFVTDDMDRVINKLKRFTKYLEDRKIADEKIKKGRG